MFLRHMLLAFRMLPLAHATIAAEPRKGYQICCFGGVTSFFTVYSCERKPQTVELLFRNNSNKKNAFSFSKTRKRNIPLPWKIVFRSVASACKWRHFLCIAWLIWQNKCDSSFLCRCSAICGFLYSIRKLNSCLAIWHKGPDVFICLYFVSRNN